MKSGITRRVFFGRAAGLGLGAMALGGRRARPQASSGRLRHAGIGIANQGRSDLSAIIGSEKADVVALCDVDGGHLEKAKSLLPNARLYRDWRELFDKEAAHIDSVSVATPDHMHAPIALAAIELGKHVYCEKPLTHDVYEARRLAAAAREAGVVTQMGIQIHAHPAYQIAAQMLRDGAIGRIVEWHSGIGSGYSHPGMKRPEGEDAVPDTLAWDLWLGVAPARPYKREAYHPRAWRGWRDFGTGALGDFGCHIFDPIFTAIEPGPVLRVAAEAAEGDPEVWPAWEIVHYEFAGNDRTAGPTVRATWYDGGKRPETLPEALPEEFKLPESGSMIVGEEGVMVLPHYAEPQLYPVEKFKDYPKPGVAPASHYGQWVNACLGEDRTGAGFDYAGPLTEAVLLGTIAARLPGNDLEWDAAAMRFVNAPEADAFVQRPYREGW